MSLSNTADTYYAIHLARLLQKPFTSWEAYELGIIDERGNVLRKPHADERKHWTKFHIVARNMKRIVAKVPGATTAMQMGGSYLLLKEAKEEYNLTDRFDELVKEAVVAGDAGGDADTIAKGETSGAITSPGPKTMGKKKRKVKRFKK